jgi:uncharacterized protein involved in exopolysaccharide biosynthesis/Mrp family chromosome partitioning ATPase
MNDRRPASPKPGINLNDIYHVLFRHKGKILIVWSIGLLAALGLWYKTPTFYRSQAKVLISYIVENKSSVNPLAGADNVKVPNTSGEGIINAELEILKSYDLALDVVDNIGAKKILAKLNGGDDREYAAAIVNEGILLDAPRNSGGVITITYQHEDRTLVQPVLQQILKSYEKKHVETHRSPGTLDDFLSQQADQSRTQLAQTERELRELKARIGIISLDDAKKELSETLIRIRKELYDTQSELVTRTATLQQMTNRLGSSTRTNTAARTTIPADILDQYRRVCGQLESLEKRQIELEVSFTPESDIVKSLRDSITRSERTRVQLETLYPQLPGYRTMESAARVQGDFSPVELAAELGRVESLHARMAWQNQKLVEVGQELTKITESEGQLLELQREREKHEQNYQYFSSRLERAQFDEALGPGKISNISAIQKPSPSYKDLGKLSKKLIMILGAAFAGGIALAFGIEMYVDRSVKRPADIENRLGAPLFISIPKGSKSRRRLAFPAAHALGDGTAPNPKEGAEALATPAAELDVAPWQPDAEHKPFFEALRDRLIMSFELRNLTHNPKLVAVTSCGAGAGVSTVASGLAASLSETGEGNVLLVDMNNVGRGAAHYFRKGKLEIGLDDALELEKRGDAMVQENLYVVAENTGNENLPKVLHKRFSSLLPRLRASDYDYIIFDMPPVGQLSPTSKLARFMDMVFMVVEAEKSDRDTVERAATILEQAKAHVGIVLNKTQDYVPKRLREGA